MDLTVLDTSKNRCSSRVHGGEGTFLSSLAALSVLTITSHHQDHSSHASLIFHHSRPAARLLPAPVHHHISNREHGTRITVQDLFGNMPVRVKQRTVLSEGREQERQWEILRKQVVGMLLAWDVPVMLILSSSESRKKLCIRKRECSSINSTAEILSSRSFDLPLVRSILSQASYIEPSEFNEWIETSVRTSSISIQGAISSRPAPSKHVQFLSLGIQYLNPDANKIIYDQINQLFATSSFGKQEKAFNTEEAPEKISKKNRNEKSGFTSSQLKGAGKGVDRWPMFFIRIDLQSKLNAPSKSDLAKLEMGSTLLTISNTLEAMIIGFLNDNYFRPREKRVRRRSSIGSGPASELNPEDLQYQKTLCGGNQTWTLQCTHSSTLPRTVVERNTDAHALPPHAGRCVRRDPKLQSTILADAWSSNFKLPKFPRRNANLHEGFSSWSRIKSGRRENLQELSSVQRPETMELQQSKNGQDKDAYNAVTTMSKHHVGNLHAQSNDATMTRLIPEGIAAPDGIDLSLGQIRKDSMDEGEITSELKSSQNTVLQHDEVAEETFVWVNPVSQASVSINARTGVVVPRRSGKTASVSDAYGTTTNQKRLTRNSSVPSIDLNAGSWTREFLKTWDNPVFGLSEEKIPDVSWDSPSNETTSILQGRSRRYSEIDIKKAFTASSSLSSRKLSKEGLNSARVIAQIDKKFILIGISTTPKRQSQGSSREIPQQSLVLVDQHAADERIRVEELFADLCSQPRSMENIVPDCIHSVCHVATTLLATPVTFNIPTRECDMFTRHASRFADWGILYTISIHRTEPPSLKAQESRVIIKTLPECIAERCRADTKILAEFMRGEVWKREECGTRSMENSEGPPTKTAVEAATTAQNPSDDPDRYPWLRRIGDCPRGILDMLNSRSCRSAIMFNDELTVEDCEVLIKRLALCAFPFQCAHGRPSMIPLVQLESSSSSFDNEITAFGTRRNSMNSQTDRDFRQAWKSWQSSLVDEVEEVLC